jgi:hypothetical protein
MGLSERVRRLENEERADVLKLADGSVIRLEPFDRLDALLSRVNGEDHWLAHTLEKLPDDAPPDDLELRQLLTALHSDEVPS